MLTFFNNGKLLRQINSNLIALSVKKVNACKVMKFHHITLCNVLFKVIATVLPFIVQLVLPELIHLIKVLLLREG